MSAPPYSVQPGGDPPIGFVQSGPGMAMNQYSQQPAYGQQYPQPGYQPQGQQVYPPINPNQNFSTNYNQMAPPTVTQPMSGSYATSPSEQALQYLEQVDQLLVHQKVELLEALVGFETSNKYTVKNSMGQKVFYAVEDNDCCTRNCCGPIRPFDMKILDNNKQEVIHLYRPCRCDSCLFPCCLQELEVCSPAGNLIGYVKQEWSICIPKFAIKDADGNTVLRIIGPCFTFNCRCGDVEFTIFSRDESTEVGKIVKQWTGLVREAFTDADHFGVSFPMDMDVNIKAVLLGALFLIDFMYFEHSNDSK